MDLSLWAGERAFALEVRAWLARNADRPEAALSAEEAVDWAIQPPAPGSSAAHRQQHQVAVPPPLTSNMPHKPLRSKVILESFHIL